MTVDPSSLSPNEDRAAASDASGAGGEASRHPVIELIWKRAREQSKPGARSDGQKLGLVIEGGAMRGVVSSGMAAGLEMLGLRDSFDAIYGTSAGACVGAYFIAGQVTEGTSIFYEHANSRAFINPLRALVRRPMVDPGFIFDHVMLKLVPLNWEAVQTSKIQLTMVASAVLSGSDQRVSPRKATALTGFTDCADLIGGLHASSRIPLVAGPPYSYRGGQYVDGAILEAVPIDTALADGCSHVLVLSTQPLTGPERKVSPVDRWLGGRWLSRYDPGLATEYAIRYQRRYRASQFIVGRSADRQGPPFISAVAPSATAPRLRSMEKRREVLISAAGSAVELIFQQIAGRKVSGDELLLGMSPRPTSAVES